jgi:hypothetical protein
MKVGYSPKITFITVQKRHHVRLFPLSRNNQDKSGNVQPGTVVDSEITHPYHFGINHYSFSFFFRKKS